MSDKEAPEDVEEKLRNQIVELRLLEGALAEMQNRISLVDAGLRELSIAGSTIHGLEEITKNSEILVPVGGGSYLKAFIADTEKMVVGIGAGVTAEKTTKDALTFVENQTAELQKARSAIEKRFSQVLERMETVRSEIQKITGTLKM